jgi:predicted DNA-binding transcriptional regulator AlpA
MSTGLGKDEGPVKRQTYHLEEVAKLFGIGRNQAYEGARRGDFPTIRIGKRIVAPKAAIDKLLGIG